MALFEFKKLTTPFPLRTTQRIHDYSFTWEVGGGGVFVVKKKQNTRKKTGSRSFNEQTCQFFFKMKSTVSADFIKHVCWFLFLYHRTAVRWEDFH
jgi:hypothetical protein